jgi:gliding motility-associated-like protein
LLYAFVPVNTSPAGFFAATNAFTVTEAMARANPAGFDVHVQDNNGSPAICTFLEEDIIFTPVPTFSSSATATDPECFNGLGSIEATADGGTPPFDYTLTDLSPADGIDYGRSNTNISSNTLTFDGIGVGEYEVTITDSNGCTVTSSAVTIDNATKITADIAPALPAACNDPDTSQYGFDFDNVIAPVGTIEYSADGGSTWQTSNELRGYVSGTEVFPSIRVTLASGTVCRRDFDRYIIPYPLDNLDISISAVVVNCNDLQVRVQGTAGVAPYEYTFSEDPANFNPATATWQPGTTTDSGGNTVPAGHGQYVWTGLTPGRTYVFYVRDDTGCVRQSLINVNDFITEPLEVAYDVTPTCFGATSGAVEFTLNPGASHPEMRWEIYALGNATPILVSGGGASAANVPYNNTISTGSVLGEGDYYIEVVQVDSGGSDACIGGSENAYVTELAQLSASATATRDISCSLSGLISIENISGGGGAPYTFDVSGPAGFTALPGTTDNPVQIPVNSPAGNYDITIYDQYGCSAALNTVTLALSPNPTISVTRDNCAAPISVTATGTSAAGSLRYTMVNTGDPTPAPATYVDNNGIFDNVAPGSYDVYVIDGNGCTALETAFVVHPVLSATTSLTKLLDCSTTPDAQITIEVTAGSGSYDYQIIDGTGTVVSRTALTSNPFIYSTTVPEDYVITLYDNGTSAPECSRAFPITVDPTIVPDFIEIHQDVSCNGAADGTITLTETNNGIHPLTYTLSPATGSFNSATNTFENLPPDTYTVTGTGTNGCTFDLSNILIDTPEAINVPAPTVVAFGCTSGNNPDNATIGVDETSITGGSGNYVRYEFINTTTAAAVQDGPDSEYTETDREGGNYSINVYDDEGCVANTTGSILPFIEISDATVNTTQEAACSPLNNAEIEVGVTISPASIPNLEYAITGIGSTVYPTQTITSTNNPETFSGLEFGNYRVSVTNLDTGCVIETVHTIESPDVIEVTATKLTDEECLNNGVDDGSFEIAITNYTGDYSYQVYDSADNPVVGAPYSGTGNTGTTLPPFTNLPGGVYYVRITETEAPFCEEDSHRITVLAPNAPVTATVREESRPFSVTCSNDQGKLLVDPEGGEGPYAIVVDNTTTSQVYTETNVQAHIFEGLSAGSFHITITDALGCVLSDNIVLERPDDIVADIRATPLACYNAATASVTGDVQPGRNVTPLYQYRLNRYDDLAGSNLLQTSVTQSAATFQNLATGFYSITVTDDVGCSIETDIVGIDNPTEVGALLIRTSPLTCTTGVELELSATGGLSGTYEYSTDNATWLPMTGNSINLPLSGMLDADVYRYYVRDAGNGCAAVLSNSIEEDSIEPLVLNVDRSAAVINCNGDSTAVIYANAEGGLGNYEYSLYTDASLSTASLVAGPRDNGEFSGLPMGTYYVNVISEDCTAPAEEVIITEPDPLFLVNPDDFTNVSCIGANDGTITVELTGGVGPYQYAISPNLNLFDDENTFYDLTPGAYRVIAQDSNGCFVELEYTIEEPDALDVTATTLPEVCAGEENGSIELTINGGTAPYSTRLSSEAGFVQDRTILSDLASGSYIIFVRDANGCEENVTVTVDPGVDLNASVEPVYGCDGNIPNNYVNIVLDDASISNEVLYALDSTDPADMQLNPFFRDIAPGQHYIAISHANGCIVAHSFEIEGYEPLTISVEQSNINALTAIVTGGKEEYTIYFGDDNNGSDNTYMINRSDTYIVTVVDENGCEASAGIFMEFIDIEIPNFFTPNGDAENQTWKPRNPEGFPEILTTIFDRYGREVYRMTANSPGWDGFYQQNELPSGDYWYIIRLRGENDDREFVGHFTLYR